MADTPWKWNLALRIFGEGYGYTDRDISLFEERTRLRNHSGRSILRCIEVFGPKSVNPDLIQWSLKRSG